MFQKYLPPSFKDQEEEQEKTISLLFEDTADNNFKFGNPLTTAYNKIKGKKDFERIGRVFSQTFFRLERNSQLRFCVFFLYYIYLKTFLPNKQNKGER